eukprot:2214377-Heterocapsa_arctica.AAC.1
MTIAREQPAAELLVDPVLPDVQEEGEVRPGRAALELRPQLLALLDDVLPRAELALDVLQRDAFQLQCVAVALEPSRVGAVVPPAPSFQPVEMVGRGSPGIQVRDFALDRLLPVLEV